MYIMYKKNELTRIFFTNMINFIMLDNPYICSVIYKRKGFDNYDGQGTI